MIQLFCCLTQNGTYAKRWFDMKLIGCIETVDATHCKFWCGGTIWWGAFSAESLKALKQIDGNR